MEKDEIELEDDVATETYNQFEECQNYLFTKGIIPMMRECVDFYEGRQWKPVSPTAKTKHIPRPVFNFCSKIVDNKLSNILGSKIKLNFIADDGDPSSNATEVFTNFDAYQQKEMEEDKYNYLAGKDGCIKGTFFKYYYWNEHAVGKLGNSKGALRVEVLDPLDIAVANPREIDIQKQEYVIIRDREPVQLVKNLYAKYMKGKKGYDPSKITKDYLESEYNGDEEVEKTDDNGYVTVYTKFYRIDNEVYFEKSTKSVVIHEAIALNPFINYKNLKEQEKKEKDPQIVPNMDSDLEETSKVKWKKDSNKFYLYPFDMDSLTPRDKCIWGISEIENIIENQKAVNFQYSMILLNAQNVGWSKILVKKDALRGQTLTDEPAQVVTDFTPGNGWGIKRLETQALESGAFEVGNQVIDLTRNVKGASDVITGDMVSKDLSGTAIAQIQAQAQKPIEQMQKRFWRSAERCAKIRELFYKFYYTDEVYSYQMSEMEEEKIQNELNDKYRKTLEENPDYTWGMPEINKNKVGRFNGNDYLNVPFNIVVEAGKGTQFSEIMSMDFINNLVLNGNINNIQPDDLELLIDMYPTSVIPDKTKIRKYIRNKKNGVIQQLQNQMEEMKQMLIQAKQKIEEMGGQTQFLAQYLDAYKKSMSNELKSKNDELASMKKMMMQSKKEKTESEDA